MKFKTPRVRLGWAKPLPVVTAGAYGDRSGHWCLCTRPRSGVASPDRGPRLGEKPSMMSREQHPIETDHTSPEDCCRTKRIGLTSAPAKLSPFAAAAVPGLPLAADAQQHGAAGPAVGEVFSSAGGLVWGVLGALPGGHLGGLGLTAAGFGAWVLYLKVAKPANGVVKTAKLNAKGWATERDLAKNLSRKALVRRASTLQPSLADTPRRRIVPDSVGLRLGRDLIHQLGLYIACEDGVLIFAPPRAGKTALLGNAVIDAPGAVIATTTRGDLYDTTAELRARNGDVWVFNGDVSGIPNTLRWSPVTGCDDPNVAVRRAGYLLSASATGSDMENGSFWVSNSFKVLRTYMMAAALDGLTLLDVRRWVSNPTDPQPLQILRAKADRVPAGWAGDLQQAVNAPDRTRDSIYLTLATTFEFLSLPQVADIVQPRPGDRPFDPETFLRGQHTLYMLGEDKAYGSVAPLFSCLTGEIFTVARALAKTSPGGRLDPFFRMVLDEAAVICPLPLDRWSSDAGGFGIQMLMSVQSRAQLFKRWGHWGGQELWQNLNKAVLPGLSILEDQEMVSAMVGDREVEVASTSESDGKTGRHTSMQRERIISADKVRTLDPGTFIFFHRATTAVMVAFTPVWERDDVKELAKAREKKAKAAAKWAKKGFVLVNDMPVQAPPMPSAKPSAHVPAADPNAVPWVHDPSAAPWQVPGQTEHDTTREASA
ncbi:type IV secretory system conjugative DNA transfer family protein [Kitasatospora sp. NPDC052868]|uniref:type IV secretory system conjugative DNA transfer family protein n=1 Tax=Kitasatospora sp. NPDC052868 TaxID=3364060 RepID=UPI0037CBDA1B